MLPMRPAASCPAWKGSGGGEDTPVPPGQARCRAHKAVCRGGDEGADRTGFKPSVARMGSFLGRVSNIPLRETTFPLSVRDFKSCYWQWGALLSRLQNIQPRNALFAFGSVVKQWRKLPRQAKGYPAISFPQVKSLGLEALENIPSFFFSPRVLKIAPRLFLSEEICSWKERGETCLLICSLDSFNKYHYCYRAFAELKRRSEFAVKCCLEPTAEMCLLLRA